MKASRLCGFGLVFVACSSGEATSTQSAETGGAWSTGGANALGGASATTSASSGGATAATSSLTGGAANAVGGSATTTGGNSSIGGSSTIATGGAFSVGGNLGSGGLLGIGGALTTGGASTGGVFSIGGASIGGASSATGGATATGGMATSVTSSATGGSATGGASTGGAATGGAASGGNATAGAGTGGTATGGSATGGSATAGAGTGGTDCSPLSAYDVQYVDPAAGTDDDKHGNAFGACAYKTLTYALTQAAGPIALQSGTYTSATETFPIVLRKKQELLCKYMIAEAAVIQGKGPDTAGKLSTVVIDGPQSAIRNCVIDGTGGSGYCVHVIASGSFSSSPNVITNSDIGNCGTAAITVRYANNVSVTNSSIHNNQVGVSWLGPNTGGAMLNNSFKANSIRDIECSVTDPGVTGSGNTALGVLYCYACGNCPFN